jgi:hypothetical protein
MAIRANTTFQTETYSVWEFMGPPETGYIIPIYQRAYSWKEDKVSDLVSDIINGLALLLNNNSKREEFTYIGGIITTNGDSHLRASGMTRVPTNTFSLVDGQQRISTLVIISLALLPELSTFKDKIQNLEIPESSSSKVKELMRLIDKTINQLEQITVGQFFGGANSIFPKVIRANEDKWSDVNEILHSPLARLSRELVNSKLRGGGSFSSFNPRGQRNEINHPLSRYKELKKDLTYFLTGEESKNFDKIPSIGSFSNIPFIFNEAFSGNLEDIEFLMSSDEDKNVYIRNSFRLLIFSYYFLHRVALTKVHGSSEYFAFEVFESLNTSGEPLNAYETLKPLVIKDLDLNYNTSPIKQAIDAIDKVHNSISTIDKRQKLVSDSIILFVNTESGDKISKSLSQQSKAVRDLYSYNSNNAATTSDEKVKYLRLFKDVTEISYLVQTNNFTNNGNFSNILSDDSKLCLSFLIDTRHTMALALVARFYYEYNLGFESDVQKITANDVNSIIKAVTSFSILWRAAWGGTAGIDQIYRNLMSSNNGYSRRRTINLDITAQKLKNDLKNILFNTKGIGSLIVENKNNWIRMASKVPSFQKHKKLSKFILLAAQHDSAPDGVNHGFLVNGTNNVHPCLNYSNYISVDNYTIEHIAPQTRGGWNQELYEDPTTIHTLGNLVLLPSVENSILNNRSWEQKRTIFKALSRKTVTDREAEISRITPPLNSETKQKISSAVYMPTLDTLSGVADWNLEIIEKRTKQLLDRAYEKLITWL